MLMDMRDWAVKTWRRLNERRFAYYTKRYGRPYLTGLTQDELEVVIDALMDTLIKELENGGELRIAKLGHFRVVAKPARRLTSNLDNKDYQTAPRRFVQFRDSVALRRAMNKASDANE